MTDGFLRHSNNLLYLLVRQFEFCSIKCADPNNVFEDVYYNIVQNSNFKLK